MKADVEIAGRFHPDPGHPGTRPGPDSSPSNIKHTKKPRTLANFNLSSSLPANTGPPGSVATANGTSATPNKNLSHVPCKFFKQGICQAGSSCPFSHNLDGSLGADKLPCKYFQKGNCKFGLKCALAHFLPDGTRVNSKSLMANSGYRRVSNNSNRQLSPPSLAEPIDISLSHAALSTPNFLPQKLSVSSQPLQRQYSTNTSPGSLTSSPAYSNFYSALSAFFGNGKSLVARSYGSHYGESAIVDDDDSSYGADSEIFEEDYVPSSLSDLILTPQEMIRRDSRSQSGTLLVRPSLSSIVSTATEEPATPKSHPIQLNDKRRADDLFLMD